MTKRTFRRTTKSTSKTTLTKLLAARQGKMDLKVGARRAARKTFLRENASSTIKTQRSRTPTLKAKNLSRDKLKCRAMLPKSLLI
jgi:hypothetical protein